MKNYETIPGFQSSLKRVSKKKSRKKSLYDKLKLENIQVYGELTEEDKVNNLRIAREEIKRFCSELEDYLQGIKGK